MNRTLNLPRLELGEVVIGDPRNETISTNEAIIYATGKENFEIGIKADSAIDVAKAIVIACNSFKGRNIAAGEWKDRALKAEEAVRDLQKRLMERTAERDHYIFQTKMMTGIRS